MAIATGIAKKLVYKKESAWGTAPGATGAQYLRRVTSDLSLAKDAYESAEIRTDYQVSDLRHGMRRVEGSINGELSLGTWQDFIAAAFRKAWAAGVSASTLTITSNISAKTFVRSTGSWLTDGFKVGDVVRFSGYTAGNVGMNGVNYRIVALVALTMTVAESTGMVDASAVAGITCAVTGKKILVPTTGHTNDSFYIEHWHSDINQSEQFAGCKVNQLGIKLPATGMATIDVNLLGKNMVTNTSAYYTTPTAETTTGVLAAVNGKLTIAGTDIALVTAADIMIDGGMSTEPVVGSNTPPDIFAGRVRVGGNMSAFFENGTIRDYFLNETEISATFYLTAGSGSSDAFMSIHMPRVKLASAKKDDGEKGLIQQLAFSALYNGAGGTGIATDQTTISMQDSSLT